MDIPDRLSVLLGQRSIANRLGLLLSCSFTSFFEVSILRMITYRLNKALGLDFTLVVKNKNIYFIFFSYNQFPKIIRIYYFGPKVIKKRAY